MNMEEFKLIEGKKREGAGFTRDPNSLTSRVLAAVPEGQAIAHSDLVAGFADEDPKKLYRVLANLCAKKGKAKRAKVLKGLNEDDKQNYYSLNTE